MHTIKNNSNYIKSLVIVIVLSITTTVHATLTTSSSSQTQKPGDISLRIFPFIQTCDGSKDACEKQVVRELSQSSKFILYQTDSFNSEPIANAIVKASQHKPIITELIFYYNKLQPKLFSATWLVNKPEIIWYANIHEKPTYNKTIIIDGTTLILKSGDKYIFIKNDPKKINTYIRKVLQYREHSNVIK